MMDIVSANDIVLLVNTPTQDETFLHSLEQEAGGIGFHMNADQTECMYLFKKETSSKSSFSEICGQVHVTRQQRLTY